MPGRQRTTISEDEAQRAIYIDFEGTAVDPPSLLGAAWLDGNDILFIQYVLEPALWPAAEAKSSAVGRFCESADWQNLAELRRIAEAEDRRVLAWSTHEQHELASRVPSGDDAEWFGENVINAIPIARRWKRKVFPNVELLVDPNNPMKGKHQLHHYMKLIGYPVPTAFGPGNSAQRIRYVRSMLTKKGGDYDALTAVAKAKWTKALEHNWHDCNGMREVILRCAEDV